MNTICEFEKCTGCQACVNVCPKKCISMKADEYGVPYPSVDNEVCVNCGACQRTCPVNSEVPKNKIDVAYAAWHNNTEIRSSSSSGGAAMAMYETILEDGGVVFGTKFDEKLNLEIQCATTIEEAHQFKSSKYVHASVANSYKEVKEYLNEGRKVLYISVPCQIAGLKGYLKKDYDNLITVDLICHGAVPHGYLLDHINYMKKQKQIDVDNVSFRGEHDFKLGLYHNGEGRVFVDRFLDPYFTGFLSGLFYRPNCYSCNYACDERVSDITIGDFWGLGKKETCSYGMGNGVSVLLPVTEKGKSFVEKLNEKMFVDERPAIEAIDGNTQLRHPSEKHEKYDEFRRLYLKDGFESAAGYCTKEQIEKFKKDNRLTFSKLVRKVLRKIKRTFL